LRSSENPPLISTGARPATENEDDSMLRTNFDMHNFSNKQSANETCQVSVKESHVLPPSAAGKISMLEHHDGTVTMDGSEHVASMSGSTNTRALMNSKKRAPHVTNADTTECSTPATRELAYRPAQERQAVTEAMGVDGSNVENIDQASQDDDADKLSLGEWMKRVKAIERNKGHSQYDIQHNDSEPSSASGLKPLLSDKSRPSKARKHKSWFKFNFHRSRQDSHAEPSRAFDPSSVGISPTNAIVAREVVPSSRKPSEIHRSSRTHGESR